MKKEKAIRWLKKPEAHNYPAAKSYLSLLYKETEVTNYIKRFKTASVSEFKAKDIFRASGLSLLGVSNTHVDRDRKKIKKGIALSPILLLRDAQLGKVVVADGYHRLCAVYSFNENAIIPCKII